MNRWILVLLVGLAVLLLLAPGVVGRLAETRIDGGLGAVDLAYENVQIEANSFERGWFSSVGQHRIELVGGVPREFARQYLGADPHGVNPALVIDTRLDHGLVPVSSLQREGGSLAPGLVATVSTLALDRGDGALLELPARIYGRVGIAGATTYRIDIEAGSVAFLYEGFEAVTERRTDWSEGEIHYVVSDGGKTLDLSGTLGPVSHTAPGTESEEAVGPVNFDVRRSFEAHPLGESDLSLEMESLSLRMPSTPETRVAPLSFRFENRIEGARTSGSGEWELAVEGLPGLPVGATEFAAKLRFEGLDADALFRAREAWRALGESSAPRSVSADDPASEALKRAVETLAASGGRLELSDVTLRLPMGDAQIESFSLELAEYGYDEASFNWPAVVLASTGSLSASFSENFVEEMLRRNPEWQAAIAGGFLVKGDGGYTIRAGYDSGQLKVNGAPLPLSSLMTQ